MKEKLRKIIFDKSILKFVVVGGCCTLIDFIIYMVIVDHVGVVLSKGISMGCSMIVNYFLNKFWSFSVKETKTGIELVKYSVAQVINITVNVLVNAAVLKLFGIKILAFILATGIAMVVNYLLQRFWVFRGGER